MKRAFFFTALLASLAVGVFYLAVTQAGVEKDVFEPAGILLSSQRIHLAISDMGMGLAPVTNLLIKQGEGIVVFIDELPAPIDVAESLAGYEQFLQNYYRTPDLQIKFYTPTGQETNLSQFTLGATVGPSGLTYGYPTQGKDGLEVDISEQNFSQIYGIILSMNITDGEFNPMPPVQCGGGGGSWNPYKDCTGGTQHCLSFFLVKVVDTNNSVYYNWCPLDADQNSALKIDLKNATDNDKWIRINVGQLPDLYEIELHKSSVRVNSTFVFNTTNQYATLPGQIRVTHSPSNVTRQDTLLAFEPETSGATFTEIACQLGWVVFC